MHLLIKKRNLRGNARKRLMMILPLHSHSGLCKGVVVCPCGNEGLARAAARACGAIPRVNARPSSSLCVCMIEADRCTDPAGARRRGGHVDERYLDQRQASRLHRGLRSCLYFNDRAPFVSSAEELSPTAQRCYEIPGLSYWSASPAPASTDFVRNPQGNLIFFERKQKRKRNKLCLLPLTVQGNISR